MMFWYKTWKQHSVTRNRRDRVRRLSLLAGAIAASTYTYGQTASDLLASADRLADEGNWFSAAPLYAKAETEFHRAGDSRNEFYAKFGRLHRDAEAGSYRTVRKQVQRDLTDHIVSDDAGLKIRALALLGTIDLNLDTEAARRDWQEVLTVATDAGDSKWQNRARGQLGLVAGANGDVGSAAIALLQAISTAEKLGDTSANVYFSIWLANGMSVNGMGDRALAVLDRADEVARKAGYRELPLQLMLAKIRALLLLSEPERQNRKDEAKKLIAATLTQAETKGVLGAQSEVLKQSGQLALEEKNFSKAESDLRRAVDIARAADLPRLEAGALLYVSQLYRAMHQPKMAAAAIDHGIAVLQRVEEGYDLPIFVAEKAEVEAALGLLSAADLSYDRATSLIEGLLVNAPSSRVKSSMIGMMGDIYLGHFRLAWDQLHDGPKALRIIESARGRALLDSIRFARQSGPTEPHTTAERDITRLQRGLLHARLNAVQTRRVVAQLDAAYDRLSPVEYARNRREMELARRPPVPLAVLRRQLGPKDAVIEYVLDANSSYAIRVTQAGLTIHRLPGRAAINRMVNTYLAAIRSKSNSTESAQALYHSLISPVTEQHLSALIVVPDGSLHLIPFASLVDDTGAYLEKTLTLSAAPSATVYSALRAASGMPVATRPFLGVAHSAAQNSNSPQGSGIRSFLGADLKPLQFGREEIVEAAQRLGTGSVTLVGNAATESALKSQPLREFKVVHIAAHGVGNDSEPDRAALVLEPGNQSEDGLWQAREIRQSRINAEVVVLSACETGRGRLQGQEGVMNLARAFLTAGAKSVVASLWAVDDRSTATLMESFYEHLAKGLSVREALRQAQLDFIRDYGDKAQPYFWAGFEVIGDGTRKIVFETKKPNVTTARRDFR